MRPQVTTPGASFLAAGEYLSLAAAARRRRQWRELGYRVVLTNGCFDLLHLGHARSLAQARQLGDRLIVAINDDASVRRLKGVGRPVVPLRARAELLCALRWVDLVVAFAGPTAEAVVQLLAPDVYVKGGDWGPHRPPPEVAAALAVGARIAYLPRVAEWSTSRLIQRIRQPLP